ncbi:dephospho-CoA kinase [Aliihoeflea aestuarii]|jgi:dephospho-CoA kinase|uniref:dephospho-CoA kinase n=1 Tax=Aliihoeflea aestuarii TaxID=453840 RepID=UPI002091EB52|nr:dephospho-CoA kinase [Aliihoeflea aestuarii]MCO6391019.1 dephospho-CoA kinase [Aliihoeflea aestuarii]
MIVVGLTGSIGMGKSTTARFFLEAGVPVHDSDEAVHRLYAGKAAPLIEAAFPGTVTDGVVDRTALASRILGDGEAIRTVERIVHPLVRADADAFLEVQRNAGQPLAVLDIPLLFETGGEGRVDRIVVVSAPDEVQRARVLARPGMTVEKFEAILARQVPDAEKRVRADFVVESDEGLDEARRSVEAIVEKLREEARSDA